MGFMTYLAPWPSFLGYEWMEVVMVALSAAICLVILLRFGLLCLSVTLMTPLCCLPMTTDLSAWYAASTFVTFGGLFALALYGFLVSTRFGFANSGSAPSAP
jgi:hypothetical protein